MEKKNDKPSLTHKQQRKYICETISELTHDDVVAVYRFLSHRVPKDAFSIHGSGCSINLDNVEDKVVDTLYNLVWSKRNEQ